LPGRQRHYPKEKAHENKELVHFVPGSGYADITPLTEMATALSVLESFIGQMYLVVVIAWLVGMHVSRKSN
jgi:hypothetical protein